MISICDVYDAVGQYNLRPVNIVPIRNYSDADLTLLAGVDSWAWQDLYKNNSAAQNPLPSFPYLSSLIFANINLTISVISATTYTVELAMGTLIRGNELITGKWSLDFKTQYILNESSAPPGATFQNNLAVPFFGNGFSFLFNNAVGGSVHLKAKLFVDGYRLDFK